MSHKTKVARLLDKGYSVAEIADELGISEVKTQKILDELEQESTTQVGNLSPAKQRSSQRKLNRTMNALKEDYDEFVLSAVKTDGTEVEREKVEEFLEGVRDLEYRFRKVAKEFGMSAENSQHREILLELIDEIKGLLDVEADEDEDEDEDDLIELDFDEELLEEADNLRFELVEFDAVEA